MLFKTMFIALWIGLQLILGCGPPQDYIPASQLVFPGYLNMGCSLGDAETCHAKVWFFTDRFYYNVVYYINGIPQDCIVSGNWQDFNTGQSNGKVQFTVLFDSCYNQAINSQTTVQYNTVTGLITGIP